MKKKLAFILLIFIMCIGTCSAADLNETLSDDTQQWLRDNQSKWWAKEVVLYLDQRQDIIDLNFGNFINDTVNYFRNYDDYVNYKLNGSEPSSDSPLQFISYVYNSSSALDYRNRIMCGTDQSGNYNVFFGSYEPDTTINNQITTSSNENLGYIRIEGVGSFDNTGGSYNLTFINKYKGNTFNGKNYKYAYCFFPGGEMVSTLIYKCNKTFTATVTTSGGISVTGIPSDNIFQGGNTYTIVIKYNNSLMGDVQPSSLYDSTLIVGNFTISTVPPPPEKPTYNTTYAPNINTYLDTNNNWVNNYAENQYYNITNIYNNIIKEVNDNNNFIDNVLEIYDTPNEIRPTDPSALFNYPSDFLMKLKNVLVTGYSSNFKFHMNEVVFRDHVILPDIDIDLDPRDLFGDFWIVFTYIISFMLTIPWIIWFIHKIRGESDIS